MRKLDKRIRVAIAGVGNCAGALIEGLEFYRSTKSIEGLLFPVLGGYRLSNIEFVCAFDIASRKVGQSLRKAIYQQPNNFHRIPSIQVHGNAPVYRAKTLDGNPAHLQKLVEESMAKPVEVANKLRYHGADVLINLLPTGSVEATEYYGASALEAGCAFINCIPTVYAQRQEVERKFRRAKLPLLGDDIKSQVGSTILHRAVLSMLNERGAKIIKSSQVNIGGNTDFANFVYRAETKLVSKYKSLSRFMAEGTLNHVGHHYDTTKGAFKKALFDMEATVFAGSKVKIAIQLESDDKPNSAGSIIDLIRIAMRARDSGRGGVIREACGYYMKSSPYPMADRDALSAIRDKWV
jgi:myo-inositol-1-phosphate synthase